MSPIQARLIVAGASSLSLIPRFEAFAVLGKGGRKTNRPLRLLNGIEELRGNAFAPKLSEGVNIRDDAILDPGARNRPVVGE